MRDDISAQPTKVTTAFSYNEGWRIDKHVRLVGDVTGNKRADLVGFGDDGVLVSFNNGDNSFTSPPKNVLAEFGYDAGGWRVEKHVRYLADIRGVGYCDIVGFGNTGVIVSKNDGNGRFNPVHNAVRNFGYSAGNWRLERHLRFLGDVTGNGLPDIVGFGERYVWVAHNNGDGTFSLPQPVINDFCYSAGGWRIGEHPSFIADLTGDGTVDLIGCGPNGVHVSLNQGDGIFGPVNHVVEGFGTAQGWKADTNPRYIADLTGDKRGDIIGFSDTGVYVSYNNGDGTFQPPKLVLENFSAAQGWEGSKYPRFVVDVTGDGRADIIGFGERGVHVAFNDGKGGFGEGRTLTNEFAYNDGEWSVEKTVRYLANLDQNR